MNKRVIILLIIIVSALLAYVLPFILSHQDISVGGITIETHNFTSNHSGKKNADTYSVTLDYPVITAGLPDDVLGKVNASVEAWSRVYFLKSKDELVSATSDSNISSSFYNKTTATTSVDIVKLPVLNIIFTSDIYTGGAHDISPINTLVFDTRSGKQLTLDTLFVSDYLNTLSTLARRELERIDPNYETLDREWVKQGTEPDEKNLRSYTLMPDGLHIIFDEYQVASYVAGHVEIVIPYSKLSGMLSPDYKNILK